ncbi:MAG: DNA replication/repair protein RecF [Bacilli bacterium]|jgi:DNA replication and repair protein RecF|nr:DNA replication/repair protein RecF [Bacilli bacterium]
MIIRKLVLRNFRSYDHAEMSFEKGINVIVGENAEGKTNIVEAIHYLSLARSFRTAEDANLIKEKSDFAAIESEVSEGDIKKKINVILTPSGKKVTCNGKAISRLSELSELVNVVVFEPPSVLLFKESPKARRGFLDISLSKQSSVYLEYISKYERALRERNELLKLEKPNKVQLEIVTDLLIENAEKVVRYREMYVEQINQVLSKIVTTIKGEKENARVRYQPFVRADANYKINARKVFSKALESDLKKKVTSIGPHREDFKMSLNGKDVAKYGSQGENRILTLALTLSPYFLIEDKDKRPIVVLDDVMSELDSENQERLISFLNKFEQVFITSTSLEVENASVYEVKNHKITRRNS